MEFRTKRNSREKGKIMFLKRLGQGNGSLCARNCPQLLEMKDGSFAVVGLDITEDAAKEMPPGPGVGPNEKVVKIPRHVIIAARAELPAA
ncbi:MAG: hypothetical protein P4L87_15815 [Formivibrio sp.]|nr:hypothetical protein [Formivibrio sp.]